MTKPPYVLQRGASTLRLFLVLYSGKGHAATDQLLFKRNGAAYTQKKKNTQTL